MKIENLMSRQVRTCLESDNSNTAARIMWENDCGFLPVLDEQARICGIITDRDLLMGAYTQGRSLSEIPVASVMSRSVQTCAPTDDVWDVERLLRTAQVRRLPVVAPDRTLVGVVSLGDLARSSQASTFKKALEGLSVAKTLSAICEPRARSVATAAE